MKNNLEFVKALIKEMNQSYEKSGLKNPRLADRNKDKKISPWEKKVGSAIEKNVKADPDKHPAGFPGMTEDHEGQDHEVSMANNSIDSIIWAAGELKKHLQGGERDIPAWIQDHITNAENYILQAAKNYHEYGAEEPTEEPEAEYGDEEQDMSLTSLMEGKKKPSAGLTKKQKSAIAKKARKGGDVGKKGKGFAKVEKAAKKSGARNPKAVAAAAMWKAAAKRAKK